MNRKKPIVPILLVLLFLVWVPSAYCADTFLKADYRGSSRHEYGREGYSAMSIKFTVRDTGTLLGYSVRGTLTYVAKARGRKVRRYEMRIKGLYDPSSNLLAGYASYGRQKFGITGSYDSSRDVFDVETSGFFMSCKHHGYKPDYQYWIMLLTNASNGLFIGSEQNLYHRLRCGYEGGGINCGDTDYVTYEKLDGPFVSRAQAETEFCYDITAKHVFPLGIGLKARWGYDESRWYGMWDPTVSSLCPGIQTN